MSNKIIVCNTDECTGCRICEYACSVANEGKTNPRLSRIRTIRIDPVFDLAMTCRKCENAVCTTVCARNAIEQDEETKMINIDLDKCDGCGYCVDACTYGVLTLGTDEKASKVCDNCTKANKGKPICVEYCPKEALEYVSIDEISNNKVKKFHTYLKEKHDPTESK